MTDHSATAWPAALMAASGTAFFLLAFPVSPTSAQGLQSHIPSGPGGGLSIDTSTDTDTGSITETDSAGLPGAGSTDTPAQPAPAQTCGKDCGQSYNQADGGGKSGGGFSDERTKEIIDQIAKATRTCGTDQIARRYRVDCLRYELWRISQALPKSGDYAPVQAALAKAARDLDRIAERYADPAAPGVRASIGGKPLAPQTPPLNAVRREDEDRAIREAERVIEEAQTILLRSSAQSQARSVAFQDIATALDSTKVLLRSA